MPNSNNVTEILEFPAIDELIKFCKDFNIVKNYVKGEMVLDQNSKTQYVHLIDEGYVKSYDITPKGNEKIVTVLGQGHLFPMTWVLNFNDIRYHFFSECIADTKIYLAPHGKVYEYISSRPDVLLELLGLFSRRLVNYAGINEYMLTANLEDRLAYILYFLGLKFGPEQSPTALLPFRLSHHDLASMIGASREATTLNMNRLARKGLVKKVNGHICVYLDKIDFTKFPKIYNYRTY